MTHDPNEPQRVQKLLAGEGFGARRDVEELIRLGKVRINGRTARLGNRARACDEILVSGKRVVIRGAGVPRGIAYHKPRGEVVSREGGSHATVFSRFPRLARGRWIAVGRLDVNTSGLLLACNDGELAHRLMHPSYRVVRTYLVRVRGEIVPAALRRLREGVALDGRKARFETIESRDDGGRGNRWFKVTLREGRNREVRRLWRSQGLEVSRLVRTDFAGVGLDTPSGTWRELDAEELAELYRATGLEPPPSRRV